MPRHKYSNVPSTPDHEIQDIIDAIKAVVIENVPKYQAAKSFQVDRSKLRRYMSKLEEANLNVETATNKQLFDFIYALTEKTGGKMVRILIETIMFLVSTLLLILFIFTGFHHTTRERNYELSCQGQFHLLRLEQE